MTLTLGRVSGAAAKVAVLSLLFALMSLVVPHEAAAQTGINIVVTQPTENALVTSPLRIEGEARVFENTVHYKLLDEESVLTEGFVTANSPDIGEFGHFSVTDPFTSPNDGQGKLEVFNLSAQDGSVQNLVTINVRFAGTDQAPTEIPLYRMYNPRINRHFYTTSAAERDAAIRRSGFTFEGTLANIFDRSGPGLQALYRSYNPRTEDHFYTISLAERDAAVSRFGYLAEGITGYVSTSTGPGTTAFHRLYNPTTGEHFYTRSAEERDIASTRFGFRKEGTMGTVVAIDPTTLVTVFFDNTLFNPNKADCEEVTALIREVPRTQAVGTAALHELLKGPLSTEADQGYITAIPNGVTLNSLTITNGVARADFDEDLTTGVAGSCRVQAIRAQIETTLLNFPTVTSVIISVNGETEGVLEP